MKTFKIKGQTGDCKIIPGESLKNLKNYVKEKQTVIITDRNVNSLYGNLFKDFPVIEIGTGERIKNLDTCKDIYEKFLELQLDRHSFIAGIGGGIVCDITGFVSSTYMRGLSFGFVATTLLAQVDASVGGKNGVNFKGYKNTIGTINQPEFVLCDFNLLKTLPKKELLCGFGEIIKHGAIESRKYFGFLEEHAEKILSLDNSVIEKVVYESIKIKRKIVEKDEKEKGERKKLNFGHTFGHAIEKTTKLNHGEAVAAGMILSNKVAGRKGFLTQKDEERFKTLINKLNLPLEINVEKALLLDAIEKDKKRNNQNIDFVIMEKIGKSRIIEIPIKELISII